MITWVTVWVLTVSFVDLGIKSSSASDYQLTYATREICEKQKRLHETKYRKTRCDFQQVPVVTK